MTNSASSAVRKAVLLGGSHGALALARSLRRAGVTTWLVTDETTSACFSRAFHRVVRWSGANGAEAIEQLETIARGHGLAAGLLVAAGDAEVRLVGQARARLSQLFTVMSPDWEQLRWGCDKALAYRRAQELGLGVPRVYDSACLTGAECTRLPYPLVLKPSMRLTANRFTADRAWRIDGPAALVERYRAACALVGADGVIAQQLIPGTGWNQLSYAGVWANGEPVLDLTVRRLRQYPVEFGVTSTFVETADLPEVSAAAATFLHSVRHHGLVEMEFKRDERDGALKLLDVNPRPWNWFGLAAAAGVDLGGALVAVASGREVRRVKARAGVAWMFASRDLVAAARAGLLRPREIVPYAASWSRVRSLACFAWSDPLPALVDLPLSVVHAVRRRAPPRTVPGAGPTGPATDIE
jgi:D-aspartate ligase